MTNDLIRYDLLVQDALKGVVRKVLGDAAREGLPGDHHFYVSFQTAFPGVRLSSRMREKYPDTMTIVLQHQFWDLAITEHAFEVGLSFGGVPERLLIPFDALTGFFDPSVQFGLKFEIRETPAQAEGPAGPTAVPGPSGEVARPRARGAGSEPDETEPRRVGSTTPKIPAAAEPSGVKRPGSKSSGSRSPGAGASATKPDATGETGSELPEKTNTRGAKGSGAEPGGGGGGDGAATGEDGAAGDESGERNGAEVVSLDAFRKKT